MIYLTVILWFLAALIPNALVIWLIARKFVDRPEDATFWLSVYCVILLALVQIGAGLVALVVSLPFSIFSPAIGGLVAVAGFLVLFLKWGAKAINSTFNLSGGGSTVLVIYLVVSFGIQAIANRGNLHLLGGRQTVASRSAIGGSIADAYENDGQRYCDQLVSRLETELGPGYTITPEEDDFYTVWIHGGEGLPDEGLSVDMGAPYGYSVPLDEATLRLSERIRAIDKVCKAGLPPSGELDGEAVGDRLIEAAGSSWERKDYARAMAAAKEALSHYKAVYDSGHPRVVQTQQMIEAARQQMEGQTTP